MRLKPEFQSVAYNKADGTAYTLRVFRYIDKGETDVEVLREGRYLFTVTTTRANYISDALDAIDGLPRPTYTVYGEGSL